MRQSPRYGFLGIVEFSSGAVAECKDVIGVCMRWVVPKKVMAKFFTIGMLPIFEVLDSLFESVLISYH
ncbi:MAG: hypothetical protein HN793_06575 [Rhodospirillaceae bacterium]|nr:hypothetical protein [Rhodospirillaceae bacterium]MBT5239002.1 hypothetical protein [Rhodospirillaceae bacterium]MBT5565329.1 hypothetical protein [Rhodospirillaceae bacterium]MBT6089156.1 hypothetical protein [Rhodospirillaceae bacterium]MBT7450473.1 hypothetical protein [Rhodospirillaceae bacterium]